MVGEQDTQSLTTKLKDIRGDLRESSTVGVHLWCAFLLPIHQKRVQAPGGMMLERSFARFAAFPDPTSTFSRHATATRETMARVIKRSSQQYSGIPFGVMRSTADSSHLALGVATSSSLPLDGLK